MPRRHRPPTPAVVQAFQGRCACLPPRSQQQQRPWTCPCSIAGALEGCSTPLCPSNLALTGQCTRMNRQPAQAILSHSKTHARTNTIVVVSQGACHTMRTADRWRMTSWRFGIARWRESKRRPDARITNEVKDYVNGGTTATSTCFLLLSPFHSRRLKPSMPHCSEHATGQHNCYNIHASVATRIPSASSAVGHLLYCLVPSPSSASPVALVSLKRPCLRPPAAALRHPALRPRPLPPPPALLLRPQGTRPPLPRKPQHHHHQRQRQGRACQPAVSWAAG